MAARVIIVDDHAILRAGLRALLGREPGLEVVGEAASGEEAVRRALELRPDVTILDLSMPGIGGLDAARLLREKLPRTRVLVLTAHEDGALLREAIRAGVSGYVVKRAVESELIDAIHAVLRGELYVHSAVTRSLLPRDGESLRGRAGDPASLTRRESSVIRLLAQGYTNRQIADDLGISVRTAESHRASILGKLGLTSRLELVRWAARQRLVC